jgi:hypothetical protein
MCDRLQKSDAPSVATMSEETEFPKGCYFTGSRTVPQQTQIPRRHIKEIPVCVNAENPDPARPNSDLSL